MSLESFWQTIKPFGLPSKRNPRVTDPWHHCDTSEKWYLIHDWDALINQHGLDVRTWACYAEPPCDLSQEEDEPKGPGTEVSESEVTKAPEYCPPPNVNTVHPEPATVTEKVPELVEKVLQGSPTFLPPKGENKDEDRDILLGCEEVIWVRPPCIDDPGITCD